MSICYGYKPTWPIFDLRNPLYESSRLSEQNVRDFGPRGLFFFFDCNSWTGIEITRQATNPQMGFESEW